MSLQITLTASGFLQSKRSEKEGFITLKGWLMCHVRRCTRSVSSFQNGVALRRCRCHVTIFIIHYSLSIATTSLQGRENHRKSRKRGMGGGGGGQVMKRIPRIKFPERQPNPKPSNSGPNPFIFIKVLLLHIFLTWYYYYI